MEEGGFVLMNLSKFKRWTALLHRVIVKKQNREQTHPVCLHAVEKYEKVVGIFFFLVYLESGFLSAAYLTVADFARLGISVHC